MNGKVTVYIEIEKDSNIKYEFDKSKNELIVDRILPYPFYYPFAYGFIPHTLAMDGDDLDILLVTDKKIERDQYYEAFIIGVLVMEDEKGMDEKVLCVLEEDLDRFDDISDLDENTLSNIHWFFSNYKSKTPGKWSRVMGYENKTYATQLYEKSILS